jgi:crotonobetainyl-CoA:carnitine CoA-transferase CaiB-like acyl-CoA transferase
VTRALADLRVVELAGGIGPAYCARLLADFGAQVVKVEPPGGDEARRHGPFRGDVPDPERSALFWYLNTSKLGAVLDLDCTEDVERLRRLVAAADVLVSGQPESELAQLGLVQDRNPHLVRASLVGIGTTDGPYRDYKAYDLVCQALGGVAWAIGEPAREPLMVPFSHAAYQLGVNGAGAVMAAMLARFRTGRGQAVEVAATDVLACYAGINAQVFVNYRIPWARAGRRASGSGGAYPYTILPCRDGHVCLIGRSGRDWARMLEAMGHPAWAQDPRYHDLIPMGRDYPDEMDALLAPWLRAHTMAELAQQAEAFGFPLSPIHTIDEVVRDPQLAHRGFFVDVVDEMSGERMTLPGVPYQHAATPAMVTGRPPHLGEHTAFVFGHVLPNEWEPASRATGGAVVA